MKKIIFSLLCISLFGIQAYARDNVSSNMDSLGGNKKLIRRARSMSPNNKLSIVQNRLVDRSWRLELGVSYGTTAGGDPYVYTDNLGGQLELHITPRISIGARYYNHSNTLTSEGKRVFDNAVNSAAVGKNTARPDIDYATDTYMGTLSFYPIYGKFNFFDWTTAQYDIYMMGGAGTVKLASGNTETYTGGVGMGVWLSKHFSTRLEARYQTYEDQPITGNRRIEQTVFTASIGFLL